MKLHYFNFPGRAAAARAILDYSEIPYEFVEWSHDAFKENKYKFPFGQLPVLEFDDGRLLCQSSAIVQFVSQAAGLIPKDAVEASFAFSAVYCLEDISSSVVYVINQQNEELKAQKMKDFQEVILPQRVAKMESYFKTFGSKGFCVGSKLSFADFCITAFKEAVDTGMFGQTAKTSFDTPIYREIEKNCKEARAMKRKIYEKT